MQLRTFGNYDGDAASRASALDASFHVVDPDTGERLPGLAKQEFKEECDINTILKRFGLTGELPQVSALPQSGDFTGITDFKTACDMVAAAEAAFLEFPAHIRARFDNDPGRMIAFLDDDKNREEAEKLGIVTAKPVPERSVVQAVDELAAKLSITPKP